MGLKGTILAIAILSVSLSANAALTSYNANGVDLVSMQGAGFDVSFTKDGNRIIRVTTIIGLKT